MNGSENAYAGALLFALISLAAILKIEDVSGCFIGAVFALFAAISLRLALVKSAQAAEDDHQRMEIQFQQLRSKVIETSEANIMAMNSINDNAKLIQENMEVIRVRLAEIDNLTQLVESTTAIQSTVAKLEKNSSAINQMLDVLTVLGKESLKSNAANSTQLVGSVKEIKSTLATLEKNSSAINQMLNVLAVLGKESLKNNDANLTQLIGNVKEVQSALAKLNQLINTFAKTKKENLKTDDADLIQLAESAKEIQATLASLEENSSAINRTLEKEFEKLNAFTEVNRDNILSILELLQAVSQMIDNPAYAKDLEKLNLTFAKISEWLETLRDNSALSRQDLSTLKKIASKIK